MCVSTYRSKEKAIKNTWTTYETPEDRDDTFVQDGTVCGPAMVIRTTKFPVFKKNFIVYSFWQYTKQFIFK